MPTAIWCSSTRAGSTSPPTRRTSSPTARRCSDAQRVWPALPNEERSLPGRRQENAMRHLRLGLLGCLTALSGFSCFGVGDPVHASDAPSGGPDIDAPPPATADGAAPSDGSLAICSGPGALGNSLGVGEYCTPGGIECADNTGATL